ncbi:MAG TPA: IclR family transcriptional regulator [Symbiobacteriaceae bacterium]|nr:IclR family transcriptional regulator [Symbiobacteriaceae bacterium]
MKKEGGAALTQSVTRALAILSCFSDQQPELRVSDFARILGLTQSNVSRLLSTMESLGYVERDENTGLFRPGLHLVTLAGIALNQVEIRKQALVELQTLESRLGLGANLAILKDDHIFYLAHLDGPRAPRMYTLLGRRNPLHATGMGKVLLAFLPEHEVDAILARTGLPAYTANTITSDDRLKAQLETIRIRGYGTEREELALGRACVAAPIRSRTGAVVAAISVSGPLTEINLDEREETLARVVIEAADHISVRLGYVAHAYTI